MRQIFLPPQSDILFELRVDGSIGRVRDEQPLPLDARGVKAGRVLGADHDIAAPLASRHGVLVVHIRDDFRISRGEFGVPEQFHCKSAITHKGLLIAAGHKLPQTREAREMGITLPAVYALRLGTDDETWHEIEFPESLRRWRKEIDELIVVGEEIVALDNVVDPKYLVRYDVAGPNFPTVSGIIEFCNGTWESAHQLVAGSDWVAVLSSTVGRWGSAQHITLWAIPSWRQLGAIHSVSAISPESQVRSSAPLDGSWDAIAAVDDLLLLTGSRGLLVIPIKECTEDMATSAESTQQRLGTDLTSRCAGKARRLPNLVGPVVTFPQLAQIVVMAEPPVMVTAADLQSI